MTMFNVTSVLYTVIGELKFGGVCFDNKREKRRDNSRISKT